MSRCGVRHEAEAAGRRRGSFRLLWERQSCTPTGSQRACYTTKVCVRALLSMVLFNAALMETSAVLQVQPSRCAGPRSRSCSYSGARSAANGPQQYRINRSGHPRRRRLRIEDLDDRSIPNVD